MNSIKFFLFTIDSQQFLFGQWSGDTEPRLITEVQGMRVDDPSQLTPQAAKAFEAVKTMIATESDGAPQ